MRKSFSAFMVVSIILFNVNCQKEKEKTNKDEIHITLRGELKSTDPIACNDETCGVMLSIIFQRLYKYDRLGNLKTDLVQRVNFLPGSVKIILKKDIYFNDKKQLKASDVQFCFERMINAQRNQWILKDISNIIAKNDFELLLNLDLKEYNNLKTKMQKTIDLWKDLKVRLTMPQTAIYSKEIFQKKNQFVGSSIYRLKSFNAKKIILQKKKKNEKVYPQYFIIHTISDDSSRWFFFQRDYFDVYEADGVFRHLPYNKERYKKIDIPELMVLYGAIVSPREAHSKKLGKNSNLDDLEFRRALNYLLDRKSLTQKVLLDSYKAADYPVPNELGGFLKEKYIFKSNYKFKPIYPKEEIIIYTPPDRERQNAARAIKGVIEKIHDLKAKIRVYDLPTLIRLNNERKPGIYLFKWIADYPHPSNFLAPLFYSKNAGKGGNRAYYKNLLVDQLLEKKNYDKTSIRKVQELIRNDAPWVFIGFSKQRYFVSYEKKVHPPFVYTAWLEAVKNTEN